MKNFVQEGNMITATAPYALTSGDGALVGSMFGVAATTAANGAAVELATTGVFDITALGTDVGSVGTLIYWDNTNKRVTVTVGTNTKIGVLTAAKANGDTFATVRLNGSF